MTTDGEPRHQLASVSLFAHMSPDRLDELANLSRVREYPRGQILWQQGDPGDHLIVLERGQLRVSVMVADGVQAVLEVLDPPAVAGAFAILQGLPRDATVVAQQAVTVRLIPRSMFMTLLQSDPAVVEALLRELVDLVRTANDRYADVVALRVPGRLAKWLLRQAGEDDVVVARGTDVVLHGNQAELAAELGTTRSTFNRVLHTFASLGVITIDGSRVSLLQPERLRSMVQ